MHVLTAVDRLNLVRLAAQLPPGDATRRAIIAGLAKQSVRPFVHPFKEELVQISFLLRNPGSLFSMDPRHPEKIGDVSKAIAALTQVRDGLQKQDASSVKPALLNVPRSMWMNVPQKVFQFSGVKARHLGHGLSEQDILSFT